MDQSIPTTKIMAQKELPIDKTNDSKILVNQFPPSLGQISNIESITNTSSESSIWFEDSVESQSVDDLEFISHRRGPWLRALILGANDGLVSIASLMLGIGALSKTYDGRAMVLSGLAGLVAGACSMAIGEFVSVFSQRDAELADLEKKHKKSLSKRPIAEVQELEELTQVYVGQGLNYFLAKQVAEEMSKVDALKAHTKNKVGVNIDSLANPLQAAIASAIAFAFGGAIPLLSSSFITNFTIRIVSIVVASTLTLVGFGALGAWLGGASISRAAIRVLLGGWIAMLITYGMLKIVKIGGVSS